MPKLVCQKRNHDCDYLFPLPDGSRVCAGCYEEATGDKPSPVMRGDGTPVWTPEAPPAPSAPRKPRKPRKPSKPRKRK